MSFPRIGDNDDEQTRLLRQIAGALGALEPGDVSIDEGDTIINGSDSGPSGFFSSGPRGITLEEAGMNEYLEVELGFDAATVNIRTEAALFVAFRDPSTEPRWLVPISAEESPFTIGGATPLGADTVWLTHQDETAGPSEVDVLAFR